MNIDEQNIIAMLGIESLPDDRKLAILNKMTDLVQKRLMARMLTQLSESEQEAFANVLEKNQPEATQSFVAAHFPDMEAWTMEEIRKLKQELGDFAGEKLKDV